MYWLFGSILGVSAVITATVTYVFEFNPIATIPPEWVWLKQVLNATLNLAIKMKLYELSERSEICFFWQVTMRSTTSKTRTHRHIWSKLRHENIGITFLQFNCSIGNYVIGVMTGFVYVNLKKSSRNMSKIFVSSCSSFIRAFWKLFLTHLSESDLQFIFQILRILYYLGIFLGFATILTAYFFFNNNFEKPAIWISLSAIVLRNAWGAVMGFGILCSFYNYGWIIPKVFNYPGWRILGRISYATFICHIAVVKILIFNFHQLAYLSMLNAVSLFQLK